jgi:hypothetical protein
VDAREDGAVRHAFVAGALLLAGAGALPAVAQGERPPIADEIEKRFNDRFMVVTDGGGTYSIYQRIEADLASPREVVCLIRECYVALAIAPEEAMQRASRDPAVRRPLLQLFAAARDAYAKVLATPKDARAEAEAAWLDGAARIEGCLRHGRCGER